MDPIITPNSDLFNNSAHSVSLPFVFANRCFHRRVERLRYERMGGWGFSGALSRGLGTGRLWELECVNGTAGGADGGMGWSRDWREEEWKAQWGALTVTGGTTDRQWGTQCCGFIYFHSFSLFPIFTTFVFVESVAIGNVYVNKNRETRHMLVSNFVVQLSWQGQRNKITKQREKEQRSKGENQRERAAPSTTRSWVLPGYGPTGGPVTQRAGTGKAWPAEPLCSCSTSRLPPTPLLRCASRRF